MEFGKILWLLKSDDYDYDYDDYDYDDYNYYYDDDDSISSIEVMN